MVKVLAVVLVLTLLGGCAEMPTPAATPDSGSEPTTTESEDMQTDSGQAEDTSAEESPPEAESTLLAALDFTLDPSETAVRFLIEETLGGNHKLVVGTTSEVEGSFQATPSDLAATSFGPIVIDAATFVTDSERRNGAINRFILKTNTYPEIVFTPTGFVNVPESVAVGEEFSGQLEGTLDVIGITISLSLELTAQFISEHQFVGTGSDTISREEWGIEVFMPPIVSWISDELVFEVDFSALATSADQ